MMKNSRTVGRKPKQVLTIAVDCGSLSAPENKRGGIYTLTINLLINLVRMDPRNRYLLYSYAPLPKDLLSKIDKRMKNVILPKVGFKNIWMSGRMIVDRPDIFLALSQAYPGFLAKFAKTKTLGFVYDTAFLTYPGAYRNLRRLTKETRTLVDQACHIITISEASREDIVKTYKIKDKSVSVFYPGVSPRFSPHGLKYVDTDPYFLYVGSLKPTKNIPNLLIGFSLFLKQCVKKYRLVLVGSQVDIDPLIHAAITRLQLARHVVLKGVVSDTNLPKYYRGAVGFVSPALFEGFGLPLLEAMASGTPVIAANNTSMPEVVGKAGFLVNESKPEEIAEAMVRLTEPKTHTKLKKLSLKQAKLFDSRRFARGVLDAVYKYCVNS